LWEARVHGYRVGGSCGSQVGELCDAGFLDRFQDAVEVEADLLYAVAVVREGEAAVQGEEVLWR
jgi:hypothetical protein